MWHYGIWIHSPLTSVGVVHSTWPSRAMWHMHAPTFNKWHKKKKKKKKKVTLHILTHGAMRGCGLTSLVVCINDKIRDIRERNVTIRSEIWTTNIRSLGFRDIREWVILWRLILRSLGCRSFPTSGSRGANTGVAVFWTIPPYWKELVCENIHRLLIAICIAMGCNSSHLLTKAFTVTSWVEISWIYLMMWKC